MEAAWRVAFGLFGLGAVGAFVFWSLYRNWLKLPIFQTLTKEQLYRLLRLFLFLTFLFGALGVLSFTYTKLRSANPAQTQSGIQALALLDQRAGVFTREIDGLIESTADTSLVRRLRRLKSEYNDRASIQREYLSKGDLAAAFEAGKEVIRLFLDSARFGIDPDLLRFLSQVAADPVLMNTCLILPNGDLDCQA